MTFQWGKNPEYTITICHNWAWYSGELALPLKLSWWNSTDVMNSKCNEIAVTFLCFRFGLEIWRWKE